MQTKLAIVATLALLVITMAPSFLYSLCVQPTVCPHNTLTRIARLSGA